MNWIQFKWRNHDPQIGRFIEIDPLSEKYEYNSTYAFSENKVTTHVELEGLEAEYINDFFRRAYNEVLVPLARTLNQANPLAKAGEIVSAKSIESDFTQPKPRMEATAELGMIFIAPELALEKSAILSTERALLISETKAVVSLDNNVLIAGVEKGESQAVKNAIGGDKPIVSITAAKEFLIKGDKNNLKSFMSEIGATISTKGASESQVNNLKNIASGMCRSIGKNDLNIIGNAANNAASIMTRDKKMSSFAQAIGVATKSF